MSISRYLDYRYNFYRDDLNRADYYSLKAESWEFTNLFQGNGIVNGPLASTDLQLIADDLTNNSNWTSRVGGWVVPHTSNPTVGLETPFYPNGGFLGSGYRTAVKFPSTKYYHFTYNAAHQLTSSSTTSFQIYFKTGNLAANETIWGCFIPGVGNYNLRIQIEGGITPLISATVGHAGANAYVSSAVEPYTFYSATITYAGATKVLNLIVNGQFESTSTGIGAIATDGVSAPYIGTDDGAVQFMSTSQLLEITRDQQVISTSGALRLFLQWAGMQSEKGQLPTNYVRASRGDIFVNNNLWSMGDYFPRMSDKGYLADRLVQNYLVNSDFTESGFSGWTTAMAGGTIVSQISGVHPFSGVGGEACNISTDGIPNNGSIKQTLAGIGANNQCSLSLDWAALNLGAQAFYQIYNQTSTNYYDELSNTWGAAVVWNSCGTSSLTRQRHSVIFTKENNAGNLDISIGNAADVVNTSKSFEVYHVQFGNNVNWIDERIVSHATSQVTQQEVLTYSSTNTINYANGAFSLTYTPIYSSLQNTASTRSLLNGTLGNVFNNPATFGTFVLSDAFAHAAGSTDTHAALQVLNYSAKWQAGIEMTLISSVSGVVSSLMGSHLDIGDVTIGNNPGMGSATSGYFKNIHMR